MAIPAKDVFDATMTDEQRQEADRRAAQWKQENSTALQSSNDWAEKHGLPLERLKPL